jgi:hypothetical protein
MSPAVADCGLSMGMDDQPSPSPKQGNPLIRLGAGFGVLAVLLVLVFQAANWYAGESSLPRYCDDPARHIALVKEIITRDKPVGDQPKRPFIIAAKLIYLVPQRPGESVPAYLSRLRQKVAAVCR